MKQQVITIFASFSLVLSLSGCDFDENRAEKILASIESFFQKMEEYAKKFDDAESDVLDYIKEQRYVTSARTISPEHNQSSIREFENGALFPEPKEMIHTSELKIVQVTPRHYTALAFTNNFELVLFCGDEKEHYHDSQTIRVPSSKKLYRIGTYRYETTEHFEKTVSIVVMR